MDEKRSLGEEGVVFKINFGKAYDYVRSSKPWFRKKRFQSKMKVMDLLVL